MALNDVKNIDEPYFDIAELNNRFEWPSERFEEANLVVDLISGTVGTPTLKWQESFDRDNWEDVFTVVIGTPTTQKPMSAPHQCLFVEVIGGAGAVISIGVRMRR